MTASQSNLAGLSRFIFRAPKWYTSLAFALLIAAVAGVGAFDSGVRNPTWRGLLFLGRDAWQGIFFIGIPTVVAAFGTAGVDRLVGGKLSPNRSSLLALLCEVLVVVVVTGAALVTVFTPLGQTFVFDAFVVALASIFALRLLVVMAVSRSAILVAAVPASLQTLSSALLLFVYSGTIRYLQVGGPLLNAYLMPYLARAEEAPAELLVIDAKHFGLLAVLCVLYSLGVYAFLVFFDRPWRQSLGVSVLDFGRGFIGHIAEGSRELEDFFEQIGEQAVVPVTVLSFRRRTDGESDGADVDSDGASADGGTLGAEKARFVLPMIHPGPMGEIGGGNLPERIAESAEGVAFPPHATAGHDFNLVTEREVDALVEAAERAHDRIEYSGRATPSVRAQAGEASMLGQAFGDDALLVNTFSPNFADDVEYGVGLSAVTEARAAGVDEALLVDAHNCNNGLEGADLGHVTPGSERSFDMITAAGEAGESLEASGRDAFDLGVAWDPTRWEPLDGIGPLGIRVAVTDVGGETTAYVLVDGNNMEPGLRDRLVDTLRTGEGATVDDAEVMTTDTHIVNTVEADNQVGAALDHDELEALIQRLTEEALEDREPVAAGLASERVEVTVFGNDRTETLASHANAAVAMGGALAGALILAAMAVSVLIFFLA
jgi:putative membrane protein